MILNVEHVRNAGLCVWGLRAWCRANGVDMRRLCRDGIPLTEHPELHDDPLVQRVTAVAVERGQADA